MMLLSNVTLTEDGSRAMLQCGKGKLEGLHIARLLGMFLRPAENSDTDDRMEHFANILTNVTQLVDGRKLLLEPGRGIVAVLAKQLDSSNSNVRRIGCAQALRNCFYTCRVTPPFRQHHKFPHHSPHPEAALVAALEWEPALPRGCRRMARWRGFWRLGSSFH
mmetsp:Transcript_15921/g.44474  ORF Transcript_15921/g.44474 Transcript_15921/m.44474 type:complete len:163 (+) Transcript_15921:236-724(+)